MKKILLALCFAPVALWAQTNTRAELKKEYQVPVKFNPLKIYDGSGATPAKKATQPTTPQYKMAADIYDFNVTQIGSTTYDLQTNNAIARRVLLYSGGKVSVVWTNSDEQTQDFTDRGTAYTHFNGTDWTIVNTDRFEPERSGWPNLAKVKDGSTEKEIIVSHYAQAGTGTLSGGTFWQANSSVGDVNFDTMFVKDKPKGPLWPRIASSGEIVHMIAVYNTNNVIDDIRNPIVYYRYNMSTKSFEVENMLLPGYDKSRYAQGSADEYSIDARDSFVAILMGGAVNDVALWKSSDFGKTWTKTIVDTNAQAPIDLRVDTPFDTVYSNDGTGNVTLGPDGVAHVFYSPIKIINLTQGDSSYSFFADNQGIMYWNDKDMNKIRIGGVIDYNSDETIDILPGTFQGSVAGYGGNNLATFAIGAVKDANTIFCVYNAPLEIDRYIDETSNYKSNYVVYSKDGGKTWGAPQDMNQTYQLEDVFATIARDVDDNLHMVWMQDETPGIYLVNNNVISTNKILYEAVPVDDILNNRLGLPRVSVQEFNNTFSIIGLYPNPGRDVVNLNLNMTKPAMTSVRVLDMMGRVVMDKGASMAQTGNQNILFNVDGLNTGVYFFQVSANGSSSTQKLVIQK